MHAEVAAPKRRTRAAIVALFFLSPLIAEVISSSTPPATLLTLFPWLALPAFYGSGALLAREIVRRRGWGWENLFVLGMAYGILEEGIEVQTWFNFTSISPTASYHHYGEFLQTNWLWAVNLTFYHAVMSITLAVVVAELLFPKVAARPWLGPKGRVGFSVLLGFMTIAVGLASAFVFSAKYGYTHPPLVPFLIAIALMLILFFIGSNVHLQLPKFSTTRAAPRLWTVRLALFGLTVGNFFLAIIWAPLHMPLLLAIILTIGYDVAAIWRVASWSARPGWNASHRLAVASGIIAFYFFFGPLIELATHYPGILATVVTEILTLVALILFAGMIKRRVQRDQAVPQPVG